MHHSGAKWQRRITKCDIKEVHKTRNQVSGFADWEKLSVLRAMLNARPRFYLSSTIYAQKSPVVYDSSCHSSRYMQLIMFFGEQLSLC